MLHIISVAHRVQAKSPDTQETEVQRSFAQFLRNKIRIIRPAFIAEEDCEEFLRERHEISIAKQVAGEFDIEHRFCDPNRAERFAIGYKDQYTLEQETLIYAERGLSREEGLNKARAILIGRYFPIRERFWLERLSDCRDRAAIFVCGDGHIKSESFRRLLACHDIPYKLVKRGVGLTEQDRWIDDALQYLKEHPELKNG